MISHIFVNVFTKFTAPIHLPVLSLIDITNIYENTFAKIKPESVSLF